MGIDLNLHNKVVIISGASQGIGKESAIEMAAEGANLFLSSRSEIDLNKFSKILKNEYKIEIDYLAADLKTQDTAKKIVSKCISKFGKVDILINSAGSAQGGLFWEIPDEVWENAYELKLMGTVRLLREVIPIMRKQKYGRIVNVVGDSGKQPNPLMLPGSSVNAALLSITKGLADSIGDCGIAINAVNPGPTQTDRIETLFKNLSKSLNKTQEEIKKSFMKDSPLNSIGDPKDIAKLILFLASDASENITGTSITSDGGRSRSIF
ncbi:SDR family oxidoreductase [Alphaproteobacteria bacterium]|nr:SDR family oxidoreductase [Alphaproteobacteria bacterium]